MDDSFIIANFHSLCRLCLNKSNLMVSIYGTAPDDDLNMPLTSKIADCIELQINSNDGLPSSICYKCVVKIDQYAEFKLQCIASEMKLKQITSRSNDMEHINSSESNSYSYSNSQSSSQKIKNEDYIVEDSVVMVVDPSLDCDSTEESDNPEQVDCETTERDNTPDNEPVSDSFFKNVFMCQYCDQAFITQERCKEHELNFHDPNLPYNCVECSLVFAERSQSIQHTKLVHCNDKPYHCPECDKSFGRRSDLRKHSIVHTGIRPYQCHFCLKSFSRNTNLSKHLRIHAGRKPHVCPLCPRSFVDKGDLDRHVLVHSGMKPYSCRKCPLTFGRKDKLLKHEARHGPITPDHKTNQESQNDHNMMHDMVINVNPFSNLMGSPNQCEQPISEYDLPRVPDHITGESSFLNQIQKNPSTSKKIVSSKQKTSPINKNRPKNIKCHQCPKRFASLDAYKTHVSIAHIGSRNFQCKICFKKFSRKRELDRHSTVHTSMKMFSCDQCDKKFNRKDKLVKHADTHNCPVANMPCIECGATFQEKPDLVAHLKSHISEDYVAKMSDSELKTENDSEFSLGENFYDLET